MFTSYEVRELVAVFVGGSAGALARAGLTQWFPPHPGHWPWVTFGVNVMGAFLLGLFAKRLPRESWERPLLESGFCGALTTFSTVQVELLRMLDRGSLGLAFGYAGASVAAGLVAVRLGRVRL